MIIIDLQDISYLYIFTVKNGLTQSSDSKSCEFTNSVYRGKKQHLDAKNEMFIGRIDLKSSQRAQKFIQTTLSSHHYLDWHSNSIVIKRLTHSIPHFMYCCCCSYPFNETKLYLIDSRVFILDCFSICQLHWY